MINITFNPQSLELEVTGHAGADEKGKDIVCSAVSMLFYTLADSLNRSEEMLKKHPIIKMEDGNGYIKCRPKKEFQGNITLIYWTILNGYQLLAEEYKEYITFKVEG
jgi:uncharacterized protein YsxB (DUF464 family)